MAVLSLLESCLAEGEDIVNECVEGVDFLEDGSIRLKSQLRPDFGVLLAKHNSEIKALSEFIKLRNFIAKGELAKELMVNFKGAPTETKNHDYWLYQFTCAPLISRYLSEIHSPEFKEEAFDKVYKGIEDYCYHPTIRLVHTAPLFYFDMQAGEEIISLAPNLVIRRLTTEERSDLWHRAPDSPSLSRQDAHYLRFAAEATRKTNKHNLVYNPKESLINLEALLRLITRQPVAINFVLQRQEPWFNSRAIVSHLYAWPKTRQQRLMPAFTPIAFTAQHVEVLQRLWNGCVAMGNKTRFTLALHRFGSSYDEAKIEDKLLDLWIGLEALFSEGIGQELTYRISLRVAYFLGKNHKKRKKIKEDIKRSYDCRGKIVHGKPIREDLNAVTKRTENYLAASLKLCLSSRTVPSAEELETKIIEGGNL